MTTSLVAMYHKGAITADHLTCECLHRIDPENPALVLGALPDEILTRMLEFIGRYRPGGMVTNYGILPAIDQVEAARRWIEEARSSIGNNHPQDEADWDRFQMGARILEILKTAPTYPSHDADRVFMTAYQIAIEFARLHREDFHRMGRPIGGAGAGNNALSNYIAGQLSQRISAGKITGVELQFLHSIDVKSLTFKYEETDIVATPNDAGNPNSMFRLRSLQSVA